LGGDARNFHQAQIMLSRLLSTSLNRPGVVVGIAFYKTSTVMIGHAGRYMRPWGQLPDADTHAGGLAWPIAGPAPVVTAYVAVFLAGVRTSARIGAEPARSDRAERAAPQAPGVYGSVSFPREGCAAMAVMTQGRRGKPMWRTPGVT